VGERERIPELDGLRGIAIGTVLFFHYFFFIAAVPPGSVLSYLMVGGRMGWSGVDLFFVLSGFLIGGILLDARDSSNFFCVFYLRRFFRIIPAYLLLLTAYLLLNTLVTGHSTRTLALVTQNGLPIGPYFLFLQNFWMGAHNTLGGSTLGITWSLAIEEQFYLTLPLLIRLVPRHRLVSTILTGVAFAEVLRLLLYFLFPKNSTFYFVLMPYRADALLLGVFGAYAVREPAWRRWLEENHRRFWIPLVALAVGMAIMLKLLPRTGYVLMALGGYTWIAAFFLCGLMYGVLVPESWLSHCLRWGWLRSLGLIAYGTYLFHELALNVFFAVFRSSTPHIVSLGDLFLTLAALATTIVFCSLSWKYFEKPLVRIGHRWHYQFEPSESSQLAPSPVEGTDAATP